ncbi:hypothetical protein WH50_09560 [Pokkaliibacter plantistimulans]|uniref:DUF4276 family protein n=1 Tax=Pokkaliibacter plantistimulans TaxID=1635171 RepID=A0ABX5LXN5_9GAMM|nr:DUF4276 family protein [Pokkaliibacter plantistimulans]PXF31435.1 hypothetical protein WH50_09560 [Pokkaliibacter plantistimulans]
MSKRDKPSLKLFVEGGGDSTQLKTECREGFTNFITKAGIRKRPRIVACGSRNNAYNDYCTAVKNGEPAMLLVDSETAVDASCVQGEPATWTPWTHLHQRDQWGKPAGAQDVHCHLMVECMEAWLIADQDVLQDFFGQQFQTNALPVIPPSVETRQKTAIYNALKQATRNTQKGEYGKGSHSFKLLGLINPEKVITMSPWAKRFVDQLKHEMQ